MRGNIRKLGGGVPRGGYARSTLPGEIRSTGPPHTERHIICDDAGEWPCEREYADKGISERWLRLSGWHRNGKNEMVYRYTMVQR